jgi:[acyl-carrier-protein] S-malonyltransferase
LLLFPGQGSQSAGMAEHLWDYPTARATFAEAGDMLGWDIGELCRHGSMEELTRTDRTQLAVLTCSVAAWRVLEEEGASFMVAAGHSLGEYSALVATGHLDFADALWVVEQRGQAMQICSGERDGTMAAIIGLESEVVEEVCASLPEVWLANYNAPGQLVISGSAESVRAAGELAQARGAKRVLPLPVSGAFHTSFMAGAAETLSGALAGVVFGDGANVAQGPGGDGIVRGRFFSTTEVRYPEPGELAGVLARQLTSPVRFTQSMEALLRGPDAPDRGLEVGPGAVLTGLMKRIARDLQMDGPGGLI